MENRKLSQEHISRLVQESINELYDVYSEEDEKEKRYVVIASAYIWAKNDEEAIRKGKIVAGAMNSANPEVGAVEYPSMDKLFERPWGMGVPREIKIEQ